MEKPGSRSRMLDRRDARPTWDEWEGVRLDETPIVCPACYAGLDIFAGEETTPAVRMMEYMDEPYENTPFLYVCRSCRGCLTPPLVASVFYREAPFDSFRQQ